MGLDDEDLEHAHGGNAPVSDVFAAIVLALGIGFACCGCADASLIARTPSRPIVAGGYVSPSTRHP